MTQEEAPEPAYSRPRSKLPLAIGGGVVAVLLLGGFMVWRADSRTNKVALVSRPKPVTVTRAKAAMYLPSRIYVGLLQPGPGERRTPARVCLRRRGPRAPGRRREARRGASHARLSRCQRIGEGDLGTSSSDRYAPAGGRARGDADARPARRRVRLTKRSRAEDVAERLRGGAARGGESESDSQRPTGQRLHPARSLHGRGRTAVHRSWCLRTSRFIDRHRRRPRNSSHDGRCSRDRLRSDPAWHASDRARLRDQSRCRGDDHASRAFCGP